MMTVAELIAELQRMPSQGAMVRVSLSSVVIEDEVGEHRLPVCGESTAAEVDDVRNAGPYVVIRGR